MSLGLRDVFGSKGAISVNCTWVRGPLAVQETGQFRVLPDGEVQVIAFSGGATGTQWALNNFNGSPQSLCSSGPHWSIDNWFMESTGVEVIDDQSSGMWEVYGFALAFLAVFVPLVVMWAAYKHFAYQVGNLASPDDEDDPLHRWTDDEGRERWKLKGRTRYRMDQ